MTCTRHHSQHMYQASAYSVSAEFERPKKHSLAPQASVVLAGHGGHGSSRASAYNADGLISFKNAYSEVGGSFDDCHGLHTTHAWSVVEGLNVADMLTADRVVARMAVYHHPTGGSEATYDITGSYFENLRIAGHPVDVKLATHVFHDHDTYSKLAKAHQAGTTDEWLVGSKLKQLEDDKLVELQDEYHALIGMSEVVKEWKKTKSERPKDRGSYWFSPANHLDWKGLVRNPGIWFHHLYSQNSASFVSRKWLCIIIRERCGCSGCRCARQDTAPQMVEPQPVAVPVAAPDPFCASRVTCDHCATVHSA